MRLFEEKIKEIQYKQSTVVAIKYLLLAVSIFILTFNVFMGVYFLSAGHIGEKFLFAISLKITLALAMIYFSLKLNRELLSRFQAAKLLDKYNSDVDDTYQNSYELFVENRDNKSPLLEEIFSNADLHANNQKIKIDYSSIKSLSLILLVIIISNAIIWMIIPQKFDEAKIFFALRSMPQAQHKEIVEISPGNKTLLRGAEQVITIIEPEPNCDHTIFFKQNDVWREQKVIDNIYKFQYLENSTDYYVINQFATSDTFRLELFELPAVKEIIGKVKFPKYTKLPDVINKTGNFQILDGSEIALSIVVNNPIETAKIIINENVFEMTRLGKSTFSYKFIPKKSGYYYFSLKDILGNNSQKITKNVTLIKDEIPKIEIVHPAVDTVLSQNMLLPLVYLASDDFGIDDVEIYYYLNSAEKKHNLLISNLNKTLLKTDYIFDVENLGLFPGDKISYWLEISDNNPDKQRGKSALHTARFPSIEEIYNEISQEEQIKKDVLNETLKKADTLNEEFEEKRRELMKKDELEWEDKKDIEKFLEDQKNLNEDVEKLASDYQNMMQKYEKNMALSSETLEKMEKIRELMEEISNDELREAMEKMQNSMENMDTEAIKKAMDELKFSMEDFAEKLEQTLQLLEDIKKEQALQKANEIAQEMEKMQADLNEKTEQGAENNEDLAKHQKAISEKLESLEKQIEEASNLLDENSDAALKEMMEQLQEQMEKDDLEKDLQEASENLESGEMQKAQKNQKSAQQKMQKTSGKLSEMSAMMSSMSMDINMESIDIAINRLLIFSAEHEDVLQMYNKDPYIILEDLIANFDGINKTMQELYSTPMILMVVGPKFMYDANKLSKNYQLLFSYINDAKNYEVNKYLQDIQINLNVMIYDLIQAKNDANSSSGSGGGMQSMMQSMQQMGQQQMMMNMMASEMMQQLGQDGRMSSEMRQKMGKMAADEQRLADNLKRAIQNNPEAQKQVGSLNRIIEDLESISRNLKRGRLTQDIIDTQERILSRLLDAQKSIHKREFSKKRKSENSEIDKWDTPEEIKLKFENMRRKALLEEDYQKYSQEYQELIREYLKKLNEE